MKRSRLPPFSSGDQNSSEDDDDLPKKRLRQLNRRDILDDEELPLQSPARFPQPAVAQPIHPNTRKNKNHKKKPHEDPSESEAHKPKRRKNKASEDQHSQVDSTTQDGSVPSMRRRKAADGRKNEDSSSNLFSDTSSPETKPKRAAPSRKRDSIVAEEAPESQSWIGLFGGDAEESDQEGPEDPSLEESESPSGDGTLAWTHLLKDALKKKKVANAGDAGAEVNKSPESFIESAVVDLEDFIESNFENDNVDYKRLKDSKADELKKQQKRRVCAISEITAKRYRDELLLSLRFVSPHQPMWSPVDPPPFCPIVSFPNYVQKDNGTTRPIEEQERAAMGLKAKWSLATIGAAKWLKVENCLDHDTIMHEDDEFYRTEAKFFGSRNSYLKLNLSHCSELLKQQYPVEIEQINKRFHWTNDEIEAVKKFTKEHKIFSNLIKQASTRAKKSGISSVKPCDTVAGVVGSEERSVEGQADAIVENERPADAIVENERLTDGIVENEGQADAIVENERPADGIVENKPQADGTEENERPADGGTEENERAADGTEENERAADGTEENERADSIVETDGDGVIGKDFQSMSKGVVISDPPAKVSHIRVVKPTGPKQLRMKDFFSTPKSKAPTMENSSKFNNNVDAAARGEDVGSLKDSLAHSKSDLKNDDKTEEDADDNSSYEDPEGWRSFIDKKKSSNKTVFVDELASDEDGCDEVASSSHEDDEEEEAKEIYSTLISNKKEVDKENVLAFHNVIMEEQIEKEYISKFTEAGAKERRQKRKEELEAHLTRRQIERQNNADGEDQRELDEENEIERYLMELKEKMSSSCSSGGTASSGISSDIESSDNVNGEEEEVIQFSSPTPYQKKRPQRTQRSSDEVVLPKVDDDDDDDQHVAFCDDDNNDSARHLFPPSSKWDLFTTKSF